MSYSNTKKNERKRTKKKKKNRIYYGDVGYFNKLMTTTQTRNEHFEINEKGTVDEMGASEQKRLSKTEKEGGKCSYECAFEHHNIGGNLCMVANRNIKLHKYRICFSPFFFHFPKIIAH